MRESRAVTWALGVALAIGWATVRLTLLPPPVPSDQLTYLLAAQEFPYAPAVGESTVLHQWLRYGLVLPVRLAIEVFGYSEAAYYVVPLFAGLLLLVGTYVLGCQFFGRTVGIAAALLVSFNTHVFDKSGDLLPDLLATALTLFALALTVAIRRGDLSRPRLALVVIGLLLGWSYLVREFIVLLWPLIPALLWRRVSLRDLLFLGLPLIGVVAAEMLLMAIVRGDALARIHATAIAAQGEEEHIARTYRNRPVTEYLDRLIFHLNRVEEKRWLLLLLGVTVAGGIVRPRKLGFFLGWIALLWVPLTLLGGLVNPASPTVNLWVERYWFPIFPAFVLGGLGTIWLLVRWAVDRLTSRPPVARYLAGAVAGTVGFAATWTAATEWTTWPKSGGHHLSQARTWLAETAGAQHTVWGDNGVEVLMRVYRNGPFGAPVVTSRIELLSEAEQARPGDYVMLYDAVDGNICSMCPTRASRVFGSPLKIPETWRTAFETPDGVLQIYQVTPSPS
ncbi:glycosyltransferase family 39 protein [Acrocarpospora macrocephala]|uniref:glycosyltransferase family 39 protein n=1 Tax=Acrocarpospora macrocephala TaxID=150177 RepID=UPI001C3FC9F9|nr:glycosyltransferase family 39 protein [Acrocarpospora macrocephala]